MSLYDVTVAVVMLRGRRADVDALRDAAMQEYALRCIEALPFDTQSQSGIARLVTSLRAGDVYQLDVEEALDDIAEALQQEVRADTAPPSDTVRASAPDGCLSELPCEVEPRSESAVDFAIAGMAVWGGRDAVQ